VNELSDVEILMRDGVSVARVRGEIDLSNADAIFSTLARAGASAPDGVIVDLSEVEYLDSAGVRLLFRLARALGEANRTLRTVVPGDATIRRVLELANMQEQIGVDESEDAALASVKGAA
jgi:anti-anti-sigma factor